MEPQRPHTQRGFSTVFSDWRPHTWIIWHLVLAYIIQWSLENTIWSKYKAKSKAYLMCVICYFLTNNTELLCCRQKDAKMNLTEDNQVFCYLEKPQCHLLDFKLECSASGTSLAPSSVQLLKQQATRAIQWRHKSMISRDSDEWWCDHSCPSRSLLIIPWHFWMRHLSMRITQIFWIAQSVTTYTDNSFVW